MTQAPWLTLTTEMEHQVERDQLYHIVDTAKNALRADIEIMLEHDPKWVVNFLCDTASRVGRDVIPEEQT